ncbi:MAG: peptide ABC transporter substrate-binding protein, partial [Oscillospiraceae bacterium]|nr:peptide ABC transporter substrate-binding protein [Oscillospiraceae bacterium]
PTVTPIPVAAPVEFVLPCDPTGSFHPITGNSKVNLALAPLLYRGLFALDRDFQAQNDLCKGYTVSEDGLTWTFTLIESTFSDGSALSAAEVIASLNLARQSERYRSRLRDVTRVGIGEGGTVTVTLSRPNGALPALLDVPVVKENREGIAPLGTGPYVLTRNEETEALSLTAREGAQVPRDTIPLRSVGTSDDLIYAFDAGEISLVDVDLNGSNALGFSGRMETTDYPTTDLIYLGFNMKSGACKEEGVRQAISLCLDRPSLVERYLDNHAAASPLPVHPRSGDYDRAVAASLAQDTEEAQAILTGLGWQPNEEGLWERRRTLLSLKLIVNQENTAKAALTEAVADALRELGCTVTVDKLPWEDFTRALERGNFDLYLGETVLTADFDPEPLFHSKGELNYGGCDSEELDALLDAYRGAYGGEQERTAAASALWAQVAKEAPIGAICFKNGSLLTQWGQVSGVTPTQRNLFFGLENWKINE